MQVRQATLADVPAIVAMSEQFYGTTSYRQWADFCPDTVADLAANLTENHVMLVAEQDGALCGMVGLFVAPFMFKRDRIGAYEVVWWVNPEAQGAGAGKALLAAIEPACKTKGAGAIQMVHLASSPPQAAAIYAGRHRPQWGHDPGRCLPGVRLPAREHHEERRDPRALPRARAVGRAARNG